MECFTVLPQHRGQVVRSMPMWPRPWPYSSCPIIIKSDRLHLSWPPNKEPLTLLCITSRVSYHVLPHPATAQRRSSYVMVPHQPYSHGCLPTCCPLRHGSADCSSQRHGQRSVSD